MVTQIAQLPTPPSRQRPSTFSDEADVFLEALPTFGDEANTLAVEVNTKTVQAVSSASSASTSAGEAATSASSALSSSNNANAKYKMFDERYLGSKTADPTTDNYGQPLLVGAEYWNSTTKVRKVWTGTSWQQSVTSGDMIKAVYDSVGDGVVNAARATPWTGITGKPAVISAGATSADARAIIGAASSSELTTGLQSVRTDLASTEPSKGSEMVGFKQQGVGAVARSLQDKARELVSVKDFGAVGDGVTDDTAALNNAFLAASGKVLLLGAGETYRYNTTVGLTISNPINIISNGSKFREITANNSYKFSITSDNVKIDSLVVEFVGASNAQFIERGISIVGSNIQIDEIIVIGDNPQTGANSVGFNAVKIGPDSAPSVFNVKIGSIKTINWDRPVVLQNITQWQVGRIECITYRRGVYIKDCTNGEVLGGTCYGASPTNTGKSGENGILIEAVADNFSTNNIRINNFHVEDAGEHGFRIGGQMIVENIWHIGCSALNTGLGNGSAPLPDDDDHGGCGFKVLGPTSVFGARHQGIHYVSCSVKHIILDDPGFHWNFAGFQLGKVIGGSLVDCSVSPSIPDGTYSTPAVHSCENGIEVIGCENITINNPSIYLPRNSGVYIYDANQSQYDWGLTNNVKVVGGFVRQPGVACVEATANHTTFRRVAITGLLAYGGMYALKAAKSGDGGFTGCSFQAEVWNQTSELLNGAVDWMVGIQGQLAGSLSGNICKKGSWFSDWGNGVFRIRENLSWGSATTSLIVTLADDTAISFAPRHADGHVFVSMQGSAYYGHAWMRTSSLPVSVKVSGGVNFAVANAALSGTTGADGSVTLGAQPGMLYVENRSGESQTISITQT